MASSGIRSKAVRTAVLLAMTALRDERVREQLRKAPVAAKDWADRRRRADGVIDVGGPPRSLDRFDPTKRFGHRGLDRRLSALSHNVTLVFADSSDPAAVTIRNAVRELRQANDVSATMPLAERRRTRQRIGEEVGRLERGLVDAVLPPESPALR